MIDAAKKLLDDFRALPGRVERPRTFMEIAGYPHYENVCSNIFAFFMDPTEAHGLDTLVLDALATAIGIEIVEKGMGGNISVEREVITDKGNRIDLLITSDDHAVLIENKIYASTNNPFDDYSAYLDRISDGRAKHKLLLTLYPTTEGSNWDFTNLTYTRFVEEIRSLLGFYVSFADARHLTMFLDFLNTLESLQEGTRMDQEFIRLLSERTDDAENLFARLTGFKKELRRKVQELGTLIDVGEHENVTQWFWRERMKLYDVLVHDIHVSEDLPIFVDAAISPHGWEIEIFVRGRDGDRSKLSGDRSKLKNLLQRWGIPFKERKDSEPFVYASFDYSETSNRISPVLQGLVNKLATSRECE